MGVLLVKPANNFSLIREFVSPGLMFTGQEVSPVGHIFLASCFNRLSIKFMTFCFKLNVIN